MADSTNISSQSRAQISRYQTVSQKEDSVLAKNSGGATYAKKTWQTRLTQWVGKITTFLFRTEYKDHHRGLGEDFKTTLADVYGKDVAELALKGSKNEIESGVPISTRTVKQVLSHESIRAKNKEYNEQHLNNVMSELTDGLGTGDLFNVNLLFGQFIQDKHSNTISDNLLSEDDINKIVVGFLEHLAETNVIFLDKLAPNQEGVSKKDSADVIKDIIKGRNLSVLNKRLDELTAGLSQSEKEEVRDHFQSLISESFNDRISSNLLTQTNFNKILVQGFGQMDAGLLSTISKNADPKSRALINQGILNKTYQMSDSLQSKKRVFDAKNQKSYEARIRDWQGFNDELKILEELFAGDGLEGIEKSKFDSAKNDISRMRQLAEYQLDPSGNAIDFSSNTVSDAFEEHLVGQFSEYEELDLPEEKFQGKRPNGTIGNVHIQQEGALGKDLGRCTMNIVFQGEDAQNFECGKYDKDKLAFTLKDNFVRAFGKEKGLKALEKFSQFMHQGMFASILQGNKMGIGFQQILTVGESGDKASDVIYDLTFNDKGEVGISIRFKAGCKMYQNASDVNSPFIDTNLEESFVDVGLDVVYRPFAEEGQKKIEVTGGNWQAKLVPTEHPKFDE